MIMEKFLYSFHPVRCIITGPSECGKSYILTKFILSIINEYEKKYIYEFQNLTNICWNEKYQCPTIDMSKDKLQVDID